MISTKKILVIVLMAVLASSVIAGASTLFRGGSSPPTPQVDINNRLNNVVDYCLMSLPNGIPECDNQLREIVTAVCSNNNNHNSLDACHDDKVNLYYKIRANGSIEGKK